MPELELLWAFACSADKLWAWSHVRERVGGIIGRGKDFPSLNAATADATKHGFDPFVHYWTSTTGGCTTHYRPGQTPVTLPTADDPY